MREWIHSNILEHTLVILQTSVLIICLAKCPTFLGFYTKSLAWHTTLRYNHFICEKEHWKVSLKSGNVLKDTSQLNNTHKSGGGGRHLGMHAGTTAN